MRSADFVTPKDLMRKMIRESPHKHKIQGAMLAQAWKQVMPAAVQRKTTRSFLKEGKFFVQLDSSSLRQELQLNKGKVLQRLREQAPDCTVTEVVFL